MQKIPNEFGIGALNQVVDQSPVSILITNNIGEIKYVNPAFSRISGYSLEEVIDKNPRFLKSGKHNKEFYENIWNTLIKGETWKGEFLNKKKDGTLYWEAATLSPVFDDNKKIIYYVGIKEDITEKKISQEKLLLSEMQFRNLAETAPITITKIDKEGNLLYFNNYFKRKDLKPHTTIYQLLNIKDREFFESKIDKVFANTVAESFEIDCEITPDIFETYIVKISPNVVHGTIESAILIVQDVSELFEARNLAKKSEEYTRLLADNVSDFIWIIDENRKFTFISPSIETISGYTQHEFQELDFGVYLPDKSIKAFDKNTEQLAELLDSERVEVWESEFKKKDSTLIWIETRARVIMSKNNKFNGIIGVTRDITERKLSEKAIYESEVKFRSFFENSNSIILVIDPQKEQVIDANRAAVDYYGYSPAEFLKLNIQKELVGLIEAARIEAAEILTDFKNVYTQNHRLRNKEYRDVEILPARVEVENKILVYTIIQDVTQRKKAIEALKESESKKLALLKIIPDLIFILNKEGEFQDVYTDNPERLVVPPYKLLGKKCYHIFPGGLCSKLEEYIAKAIKTREIQSFEYRYKKGQNQYVYEEIRIIVSGEDEVLAIIRDVTTQKNNELELKRAWEEAQEANKVKGVFLANISHEIRTPINAILGFGELLRLELTNPNHIQYIDSIRTSSKSLLNLINDLLDLSKIEAGKMTIRNDEVNLKVLLDEIESIFLIKLAKKGLNFEINIDEHCPLSIQSDEMRLRQIFLNLVSNAVKFTQEGYVHINIQAINNHIIDYVKYIDLQIEVVDTGIGISKKNLSQIFEAFKQQDDQDARKFGGTGLGLTITKRLVELLNGTIMVESKQAKGSRFTIILNHVEVSQSDKLKFSPSDNKFKIGHVIFETAKVLIADDVKTNRDFLKGIFKGSEMTFIEAADGEEAISLIEEHKPLIAFIDFKMPKKDGVEVAKFIKTSNLYKDILTFGISATSLSFDTDLNSIYLDEFVPKPIDITDLLRKLTCYLPVKQNKHNGTSDVYSVKDKHNKQYLKIISEVVENEIAPVFKEISNTSSFSDYDKFARLLVDKGRELKVKKLSYIGKEILEANKTFDLDRIHQLFLELKKVVADFSTKENE